MQLSAYISVIEDDAKKAAHAVAAFLSKAVPMLDSAATAAMPILEVVDPAVVPAVAAGKAVIDEVYAAIQHIATPPEPGSTVPVTLSAETVTNLLKAGQEAKSWLSSVGVKL